MCKLCEAQMDLLDTDNDILHQLSEKSIDVGDYNGVVTLELWYRGGYKDDKGEEWPPRLEVGLVVGDLDVAVDEYEIKYCPMCGRKL